MAIYLKFKDGSIKGNVTAEGHNDGWIELHSFQFGVGRGIGSPVGKASNREASEPSVSEVTVTKTTDETSPLLFQEAVIGKSKDVIIHFVRTSADKLETYLEYTLTNTLVSGFSLSSGGDAPSESVSLNFTKVEVKYTPFDDKHAAGTPVPAGYDMATAKKT